MAKNNKMDSEVKVRLCSEEKETLKKSAEEVGLSMSDYIRSIIFSDKKLILLTEGAEIAKLLFLIRTNAEILNIAAEIAETVYPDYLSVTTLHLDTKVRHTHTLLDSINAVTGKKFSQGHSDLNRVKQKVNNILKKYGFEIITASANDFVDLTDYSDVEGFDFLELDESELITESDMNEISNFTDSISIDNTFNIFNSWDHSDCCLENYFGGHNIMNFNENYASQTQKFPAPTTTIEAVPTTVETPKNSYPNTTVVTSPTFRIKGTPQSDLSGLDELIAQTTSYAHEHQRDASNLALAMQQYSQQSGCPSNVSVIAGPIFDIDLTGSLVNEPVYDIVDLNFDDN